MNLHVGFIWFVPKSGTRFVTTDRSVTMHHTRPWDTRVWNEVQECHKESSSARIFVFPVNFNLDTYSIRSCTLGKPSSMRGDDLPHGVTLRITSEGRQDVHATG